MDTTEGQDMAGRTKAELSFQSKLGKALEERDFSEVHAAFLRMGAYFELVDDGTPGPVVSWSSAGAQPEAAPRGDTRVIAPLVLEGPAPAPAGEDAVATVVDFAAAQPPAKIPGAEPAPEEG